MTAVAVTLRLLRDTEVFFEVKNDLKKKTDFDRLVGQIEGLDRLPATDGPVPPN